VAAAEQRGLEHLRQVMFSGDNLDPISRGDSDLDDDGLLNDGPDTSEEQEEHQSESPEPLQNVSLLYGFQPPTNAFYQEHAPLGNPVLPVPTGPDSFLQEARSDPFQYALADHEKTRTRLST